MESISQILARELGREQSHIDNVIKLIDEGNTIPFIARYRKELHGAMDDTTLRTLAERLEYLRGLQERRDTVKKSIEEQGKLTEELSEAIDEAATLAALEDIYRPYKPKRRTRATVAKEKGLEPLALALFAQGSSLPEPEELAKEYIAPEKGVETVEDALAGASDIIAEMISDNADIRSRLRDLISAKAVLKSEAATDEDSVYRLYYDFSQSIGKLQGHQILAINRGEKEDKLKVSVGLDRELALQNVRRAVIKPGSRAMAFVRAAADDAYDRLIWPSMERETRAALTDTACEGAIKMFALNLRPLLMQPPVKGKVTMGLDPGYRNGCKVAVVDGTGKVLDTAVVYPTFSAGKKAEAIRILSGLVRKHNVEHIAIGNGTASRETEQMAVEMISQLGGGLSYAIVNEAGASVYSASKLAAEEFPDYDVNLRSAVSIARRLQDPLAELVKIDPKSIGVGQYQHDVDQSKLKKSLDQTVENCVNLVGVNLNTASSHLLTYISGLGPQLAQNIVNYRAENGAFSSRKELMKVPRMGAKAFEQCAGFLRISGGKNPLDATAVHPESYPIAEGLLTLCGCTLADIGTDKMKELPTLAEKMGYKALAAQLSAGEPTVRDIIAELQKPGRDPRESLPPTVLRSDVLEMKDLKPEMELTGTVRNVVDFGAFVDIGVHEDGLVHISQIGEKYVKHPGDVLKVGDIVRVKVLEVDQKRGRISLTMRGVKQPPQL